MGNSWTAGTGIGGYYPQRSSITTYASYAQLLQGPTTIPATTVTPLAVPAPTASPQNQPTTTGLEPSAYEAILYGKDIPKFAGGRALVGGRIIEGPWFSGSQTDPVVSFVAYHAQNIVSHAFQYDLTQITSARLRGQEVWNSTSGYIATDKLPVNSFDWRPGHNAQPPFAQSIARFPGRAIAYAGGIISSWTNIPLKPFGGIIPFPSVLVECSRFGSPDEIPRNDAIAAVLGSMGLSPDEYEVNVKGADQAWLLSNEMPLEDFLQQMRAVFVNYRITYTDKLRIVEPSQFAADFELTNDNILRDSLSFHRTDPLLVSREKQYSFIDAERDYENNMVSAREERFPHPTTDGTSATRIELPIVTTAAQAMSDLYTSLYEEMSVRNEMTGVGDVTLFGMEVGDGARYTYSVIDFFARVMETTHDFEKWTVDFKSGEVLNCGIAFTTDPDIDLVKLLLGFNDLDGETDFVDESSFEKDLTYGGNAQIDTAQSVFGGSSLYVNGNFFIGTDDFVAVDAVDSDFNLLPAGWTFEGRFKFQQTTSGSGDRALFGAFFPPTDGYMLRWSSGSLDWFFFAGTNFSYAWTPVLDQWYAIAIDYDGTTTRMYINGAMVASTTGPQSGPTSAKFAVGCQSVGGRPLNGWVDEFRFTNGLGRYASDTGYTLATEEFPRP